MKQRPRIYYAESQKAQMWERPEICVKTAQSNLNRSHQKMNLMYQFSGWIDLSAMQGRGCSL